MTTLPLRHQPVRFWLTFLCVTALALSTQAVQAAQTGSKPAGTQTPDLIDAPGNLDPDAIEARIAVVSARTDISEQERELVLKQLRSAKTRLEAAAAARKSAQDYAATLQSAPKTIAALNAESTSSTSRPTPDIAGLDPVRMQLKLASLQSEAASGSGPSPSPISTISKSWCRTRPSSRRRYRTGR